MLLLLKRVILFSSTVEIDVKTAPSSVLPGNAAPSPSSPTSPTADVSALDKETNNPHAIPRRHAPIEQLARQGSFRGFPALSQKMSPFKRQLSLRINELPSTVQRKTDFPMKNAGGAKFLPLFNILCSWVHFNLVLQNGGRPHRKMFTWISTLCPAPTVLSLHPHVLDSSLEFFLCIVLYRWGLSIHGESIFSFPKETGSIILFS